MIPVNIPLFDGNEAKYLQECIDTGWVSSEGPFVERFENEFARVVDRKFGVACSNGSAALDLAVTAAGIGPGDEVIMPTFTIISPAASVVRAGAIPVLIDSDRMTWNMNVNQIESRITPRTKAILVVHIYGLPVDMAPLMAIAEKHGLLVIEDAAEMHGQTCYGQPCGSFGQISTFSFYPNKHITTGEGGMVVTNDRQTFERCRSLRNLCFQPGRRFVHEELGWNFRMTNLQAALGLAQLESLKMHVARKREIGRRYLVELSGLQGYQLPLQQTEYAENIFWVFGLLASPESGTAEAMMARLASVGIGTRPFFWPMHRQPVFQRMGLFADEHHPNAEHLSSCGFYLPSGIGLTNEQISTVSESLRGLTTLENI
jgi:perosamine synthetase